MIAAIGTGIAGVGGSASTGNLKAEGGPFSGVLKGIVAETSAASRNAERSVMGLLNGSGVDVHEAMIATQKADLAFELALQVRNKAVGAYQQMMSMQF